MKKRLKKWIENCPYLAALLFMWLFLTIGSIGLLLYRDYWRLDWRKFFSNPVFAVVVEESLWDRNTQGMEKVPAVSIAKEGGQGEADLSEGWPAADSEEADDIRNVNMLESGLQAETVLWNEGSSGIEDGEQEEQTEIPGSTEFVFYTPVETDSIYYSDEGKLALTTAYHYDKVEENYFDDAAFIGDSRTLGISDYAGLDADFYCENGMTIYKLLEEKGIMNQKSGERVNMSRVLQERKYGKIYIMLGMNELGYGNTAQYLEQYRSVVEQIRAWQPDAVLYIMGNLHVSREKNNMATEFNNVNINDKNAASATLADGTDVFYLDSNPLFVDEEGFLREDLTFDGVHLFANCYLEWKEFLMEHGVVHTNSQAEKGHSYKDENKADRNETIGSETGTRANQTE